MSYVDGFVLPVPTKNLPHYKRMARIARKVWMDHGALAYHECLGDDLDIPMGRPFPRLVKPRPGESIVFSWIVYKSRKHRDAVNAKVMADPRMLRQMNSGVMPFDVKRMSYGGFKAIVSS